MILEEARQDLRFALRTLWRTPLFTLVAVATLAIGIGSTTAIFGVINTVLLRPLPYGEPEGVVRIWSQWIGFPKTWVSEAEYRNYLHQNRTFEDLAIWYQTTATFTSVENPEQVRGVGASENLMAVLRTPMAAGRFFSREEALRADTLPSEVVVLSNEAWMRRYGGDPSVIGSSVEIDGRLRTVIGVTAAGFRMPTDFGVVDVADIYFPRYVERSPVLNFPQGGGSHGEFVVGRLRDGVSAGEARSDIFRIVDVLRAENAYREGQQFNALVYSINDDILGAIRPALMALLGAVVFVLLIACANVANLLLTRSQGRRSEIAVRAALGAGRARIARQMLTESLVLAIIGGGLGIVVAFGSVELFKTLNPGNLPRVDDISINGVVLGFTALATVLTALLFGTLPTFQVIRADLQPSLGRRSERGMGSSGWQSTIVAAEVAVAVVLVMGAGLMVRTFDGLSSIDTGFRGDDVLSMAVSLPTTTYPTAQDILGFHGEAMRRIEEIPGVQQASAVRILPLASQIGDWTVRIENLAPPPDFPQNGDWQFAAPGYFELMGIAMVRGRPFHWQDDESTPPVAVVNEAFVRHFWPGDDDPTGKRFRMGGGSSERPWVTIVGVVGDVTHNGLTAEVKRKFYIPLAQWHLASGNLPTSLRFVVKGRRDPASLALPVRSVIRDLDPSLAVADIQTIDEIRSAAVAQPRFTVVLMGTFSLAAIVLSLVGIYGVISYGVTHRTQEIGIRMALGAEEESVVGLMVKRGLRMTGIGLAVGLAGAFGLTRLMSSLLYGVSPQDLPTFATVAVGFGLVAVVATYLPSRRAARVDPIRALNTD